MLSEHSLLLLCKVDFYHGWVLIWCNLSRGMTSLWYAQIGIVLQLESAWRRICIILSVTQNFPFALRESIHILEPGQAKRRKEYEFLETGRKLLLSVRSEPLWHVIYVGVVCDTHRPHPQLRPQWTWASPHLLFLLFPCIQLGEDASLLRLVWSGPVLCVCAQVWGRRGGECRWVIIGRALMHVTLC